MSTPSATPKGRLAPTPSGHLHLGNARTFLATWLSIRAQGGEIVLRIEDIDRQRSRLELEAEQIQDLQWLGLDWDGPIIRQSERHSAYQDALARLRETGLVYPCICTRKELAQAGPEESAPHQGEERRYPGTCRDRFQSPEECGDKPFAWRFRAADRKQTFLDILQGPQEYNSQALVGDFVVFTKAGWPSYQLAVVLDDGEMGITEVVRGIDLMPSTTRQIELARALGIPHATRWAHLGIVQDQEGERMAKRAGSTALAGLREAGATPEKVIGALAHSLGLIEKPEALAAQELIAEFDWGRVDASRALPLEL